IQDVQLNDGKIYILGSTKEDEIKSENYLLTKVNFDGEIISQHKIESGRFDFLRSISINSTGIVISGGTWNQTDEGLTDFVGFYDFEFNLIWQRQLENKWEGALTVVATENNFVAATNDKSGIQVYRLDYDGRTLKNERIPSMNAENVFALSESKLLLVTITMNAKGESQNELITLSSDFEIRNKSILPHNKEDYLKKTYYPDPILLLENEEVAAVWFGKPPLTTFSTTDDTTFQTVKHIRHDISFFDIEIFKNNSYVYSGKLGKQAAIFVIKENKIIDNMTFGDMGIWSSNELFRISETDYVLVTDKIRTNDFETSIEIVRVKIE
ncbi:MAG: hypothetical protein RJQ14_26225, partial [Marinoscillum sp.]